MSDPEIVGGISIPVLFPEAKSIQGEFEKIAMALASDHSVYRKPVSDELDESLEWVVGGFGF
ncbi:hypothetical protein HZB78_02190 [Candidatus Collierbacteria bacterium]|nr:hypothetical protein [Candidatus Collierbacteria bacterium]